MSGLKPRPLSLEMSRAVQPIHIYVGNVIILLLFNINYVLHTHNMTEQFGFLKIVLYPLLILTSQSSLFAHKPTYFLLHSTNITFSLSLHTVYVMRSACRIYDSKGLQRVYRSSPKVLGLIHLKRTVSQGSSLFFFSSNNFSWSQWTRVKRIYVLLLVL